jgi:hypothetical protein
MGRRDIRDFGLWIDERNKTQGQDPGCKMQDAGSRGRRADDRGQMTDSSRQPRIEVGGAAFDKTCRRVQVESLRPRGWRQKIFFAG